METKSSRLPVSVTFISTYICNIICEHCDLWRFREKELLTDEVKAMLKDLSTHGVRSISFEGGEPLTRPDIGELISFARACGLDASLVTNGTLVTRSLHKLGGLSRLCVRLFWDDGFIDGGPVYASALEAIAAVKKDGLNAAASIVLTKANIRALPAILADCAALGVHTAFTRLSRHCYSNDNSRIGSILPDEKELEGAMRRLAGHEGQGASLSAPVLKISNAAFDCLSGDCTCVITPSGAVAACKCLLSFKKWPDGLEMGFYAAFVEAGKSCCLTDPSGLKASNG